MWKRLKISWCVPFHFSLAFLYLLLKKKGDILEPYEEKSDDRCGGGPREHQLPIGQPKIMLFRKSRLNYALKIVKIWYFIHTTCIWVHSWKCPASVLIVFNLIETQLVYISSFWLKLPQFLLFLIWSVYISSCWLKTAVVLIVFNLIDVQCVEISSF